MCAMGIVTPYLLEKQIIPLESENVLGNIMLTDIQILLNKDKHTFKCLIYTVSAVCRGASKKQLRWNTLIILQTELTQEASKVHKRKFQ